MKRRVFTILSVLSLLLCVAVGTLWVKSYIRADLVHFADSPNPPVVREWFIRSNYGILYFARNEWQSGGSGPRPLGWVGHPPEPDFCGPVVQQRSPCFILGPFSLGGGGRTTVHSGFTLPHWFLAGLAGIAPLVSLGRSRLVRRRSASGRCVRCGYDLRATPERCPECGAAPSGGIGVNGRPVINGRHAIALVAAVYALLCVGNARKAAALLKRGYPLWMGHVERWYDAALDTVTYATVAAACVVYLYRTGGRDRPASAAQPNTGSVRWRDRVELRIVLYWFAASLLLRLPLGVYNVIRAVRTDPSPFGNTVWSAFPLAALFGPAIAAAMVVYDRRRIRREAREEARPCRACGYDLRATPGRCPECGLVPEVPA